MHVCFIVRDVKQTGQWLFELSVRLEAIEYHQEVENRNDAQWTVEYNIGDEGDWVYLGHNLTIDIGLRQFNQIIQLLYTSGVNVFNYAQISVTEYLCDMGQYYVY